MKGYYFITDSGLSRAGNISDVKQAEACSVCAVQRWVILRSDRCVEGLVGQVGLVVAIGGWQDGEGALCCWQGRP